MVVSRERITLRARLGVGSIEEIVERRLVRALEGTRFFVTAMTTLFHGSRST
jgi:hypothetical protein